MSFAVSD